MTQEIKDFEKVTGFKDPVQPWLELILLISIICAFIGLYNL